MLAFAWFFFFFFSPPPPLHLALPGKDCNMLFRMLNVLTYKASWGPQPFTRFTKPTKVAMTREVRIQLVIEAWFNNSWIKKTWLKSHFKMWGHPDAVKQIAFLSHLHLIWPFLALNCSTLLSTKFARLKLGNRASVQNIPKLALSGAVCLASHSEILPPKNWLPIHSFFSEEGS